MQSYPPWFTSPPALQDRFKYIAAGEGFRADTDSLTRQLGLCFLGRSGDVYATPVCVPPDLASDGKSLSAYVAPVGADHPSLAALVAALST